MRYLKIKEIGWKYVYCTEMNVFGLKLTDGSKAQAGNDFIKHTYELGALREITKVEVYFRPSEEYIKGMIFYDGETILLNTSPRFNA
jgi:hypothetical protein